MAHQNDIFSEPSPQVKNLWVVICGPFDSAGDVSILKDSFPGEGSFHLTFSSKEAAEKEAKSMNKLRAGLKLKEIYSAARVKPGWLDGLPVKHVG